LAAAAKKAARTLQRQICLKFFALYHAATAAQLRLPSDAAASHSRCVPRPRVSLLLPPSRRLCRRELPAYRMANGVVPVAGTDPAARADALVRVKDFLRRLLVE